jgi:hypothetical protein
MATETGANLLHRIKVAIGAAPQQLVAIEG